jgi:hypothetical protein
MFVSTGDPFRFLAPVQSTPFFIGILGAPDGVDANGRSPGGGGVTSFAFNSQPVPPEGDRLRVEQQRRWSLTDRIGTSGAFFAEMLQNLMADFAQDIGDFFQRIEAFAEELEPWLRDLIAEVPLIGGALDKLLGGIGELKGRSKAERARRLERILDLMGMGRKRLQEDFRKLAVTGIIPQYDYWPAKDPSPVDRFRASKFADGGNLENTGIAGLLAYSDIGRLIAFVNSATPLAGGEAESGRDRSRLARTEFCQISALRRR